MIKNALILLIGFLFVAVRPAHAYLDPGTGSYITQLLIGGALGGGYLVKLYWKKIVAIFHKLQAKFKKA